MEVELGLQQPETNIDPRTRAAATKNVEFHYLIDGEQELRRLKEMRFSNLLRRRKSHEMKWITPLKDENLHIFLYQKTLDACFSHRVCIYSISTRA